MWFFSLYLDALGYSKTVIGLLWALSVLVEIGWFLTQGRWLVSASLQAWLVLCSGLMVLRMAMTAGGAEQLWLLVLAQVLHAFTFATHHTVCIALLSQHFPGALRGRGQALYTVVAYGLPGVLGGIAGGWLRSLWGLSSVCWAALGSSLVATVLAWLSWRRATSAHRLEPQDAAAVGSDVGL